MITFFKTFLLLKNTTFKQNKSSLSFKMFYSLTYIGVNVLYVISTKTYYHANLYQDGTSQEAQIKMMRTFAATYTLEGLVVLIAQV